MGDSLDINSQRGEQYKKRQKELANIISNHWDCEIQFLPDDKPARVDAFLSKGNTLTAMVEMRFRHDEMSKLLDYKTILVTYRKLELGKKLSKVLCVPFYFFLLSNDGQVLYWKVAEGGEFLFDFETKTSATKATCNGGIAHRLNAFLPCNKGTLINKI